jgi:hypothetical protein
MQDLLEAYRKEYKREEQKGNVEKMYSDPIFIPTIVLTAFDMGSGNWEHLCMGF